MATLASSQREAYENINNEVKEKSSNDLLLGEDDRHYVLETSDKSTRGGERQVFRSHVDKHRRRKRVEED